MSFTNLKGNITTPQFDKIIRLARERVVPAELVATLDTFCGLTYEQVEPTITKQAASYVIETLLACPPAFALTPPTSRPAASNGAAPVVEAEGVYVLGNGMENIVKVKKSKAGNFYALRLKEIGGTRITEVGETVNFEWEYERGLVHEIRPEHKMTLEQAKVFGVRYGTCLRCGRRLKAADSVERAIGPVCIKWYSE